MNKLISFLKLIRIQNLLMLLLSQVLFYYFSNENFGDIKIYLLLIITFLITAAGYIINDIFDVESDKINKEIVIIGNQILSRQAILWYYLFNITAVLLSCYLFSLYNYFPYECDKLIILSNTPFNCHLILFIILLSSIFVLRWYSKIYKHKFIIGNFLIASLTALSIFNVLFINCFDSYFLTFVYHQLPFFILVFLLTFAREIIKDLEDIKGDKLMNSKNIASSLSLVKTKAIIVFTLLITLFLYIFWTLMWHDKEILTIYNILINFMIAFSIYKVIFSKNKKDFRFISNLLKVIMILGILFFLLLYITP
jgi:4-hydroxybenzoate polyprenyltransferase|tara:strand:- start:119 stop:1048 length:930 start_codon:yes stop_codon:yes gene_type:complete